MAPKKAALAEAEAELQVQMNTLNAKRAQLQAVLDKLQVSPYHLPSSTAYSTGERAQRKPRAAASRARLAASKSIPLTTICHR